MAQQALRRQHDERQRIGVEQQRLPPQQVEVLRRGRAVGDAHVDVGRRLQEPLEPRARMIGPLALVAVRQQQHERRRQAPLGAARRDELVEHDLRAVDEVAVLRFPQHEPPRLLDVVAELEAERGVLGERAVVDLERRLARGSAASGTCSSPVTASCSTAWRWLNVPRSTSSPVRRIGDAVVENRRKASSSAVAQSTVRSSGCVEHGRAAFACAFELAVDGEAFGHASAARD